MMPLFEVLTPNAEFSSKSAHELLEKQNWDATKRIRFLV